MTVEGTMPIPHFSRWDDDRLGAPSPGDFAEALHERALAIGADLYDPAAYELVELDPDSYEERLIFYLRRRAWAEWYFGTVTPARQIVLLPDQLAELKLRLARQIADEVCHHDVFCRELRRRGGRHRLTDFNAPAALLRMKQEQLGMDLAAELAAGNQFSGEIVLSVHSQEDRNILRLVLDERTMEAIVAIGRDEPMHIANGRELILRCSESPQQRRRIAMAQERFLQALMDQHVAEVEMLGSRRIRPLPAFG